MVKQGDIIKMDFDPQSGHEQAGCRPAVVISNNFFNARTKLAIVCPISSAHKPFPLRLPLDDRTSTTGFILCEHVKSLDLSARGYKVIEQLPKDLLEEVIDIVFSEIELQE